MTTTVPHPRAARRPTRSFAAPILVAALAAVPALSRTGAQAPADSARSAGRGAPPAAAYAGPIIDVHLHGTPAGPLRVGPNPISGRPSPARSGEEQRGLTLAAMAERRVVLGVVSVDPTAPSGAADRAAWAAEGGGRVLLGANGFGGLPRTPLPSLEALRAAHRAGALHMIGEVGAQYSGMALDDPRLEPYYALAEELDLPVGVHTGAGPPGTAMRGARTFRMALGRPLALEDVLVRHPRLRVFLMHAGWPYREEAVGLMTHYPQVYADLSAIDWQAPAEFHDYLRALIRVGLGDRLMFGSDGGAWIDAIGLAIDAVDSAPFLSAADKRAIFFDNAARFFRLDSARLRALTAAPGARRAARPGAPPASRDPRLPELRELQLVRGSAVAHSDHRAQGWAVAEGIDYDPIVAPRFANAYASTAARAGSQDRFVARFVAAGGPRPDGGEQRASPTGQGMAP